MYRRWAQTHYVAEEDPELVVFLPLSLDYWNYRQACATEPTYTVLGVNQGFIHARPSLNELSSISSPVVDLKQAMSLTSVGPPTSFVLQWNSWKLCLVLLELSWPVWYLVYAQIVMEQSHLEPTLSTKYPAHVVVMASSDPGLLFSFSSYHGLPNSAPQPSQEGWISFRILPTVPTAHPQTNICVKQELHCAISFFQV